VIERTSDVDWYSLTVPAGTYNFTVVSPAPRVAAMRDPRFEIRDATVKVLASRDTTSPGEVTSLTLPAGRYRVGIGDKGGPRAAAYANIGQYRFTVGRGSVIVSSPTTGRN
jgi:hypothetical protein